MKLYFNANNKATLEALEQCGVKNVMLSHRYSYANITKFRPKFESIFVVPGTKEQIRRLPRNVRYHGLAKAKFIKDDIFDSVNTAMWIGGVLSKKTEIWNNNETQTMFFGKRGRGMIPILRHVCELHKDFMEKVGITVEEIINCDYSSLLKAPIALLFMPQLKTHGFYDENFIK